MTADTDRSRWMALYVLCGGMLMIVLDATIVNVALPSIQDDLGFSQSTLAWVVNAYLIAFGGLLLLAGRLGDLFGQRRIFLIGLAVFTIASLVCAVATSQGMLIAARFIQGAGGAVSSAVILGMIVTMFPEPREQAKAIGVYSFVASAGASIGLLAGGILTEAINWHWIFVINLPVGIAIALLTVRLVEDRKGIGSRRRRGHPGRRPDHRRRDAGRLRAARGGRAGLGLHPDPRPRRHRARAPRGVRRPAGADRQPADATPPVPVAERRRRERRHGAAGRRVLRHVLPRAPSTCRASSATPRSRSGLRSCPSCIVMGTLSLGYAEKLIMGVGPRPTLIAGLISAAAGLVLFSRAPVDGSWVTDVLPVMLLLGLGAGLAFPALMTLAMSGATQSDAGLASGLVNTTVQVGGAIGLAVLATLATERTDSLLADGVSNASALNSGYHLAFLIGAALIGLAVVAAIAILRPEAAAGEDEQREREAMGREPAYSEGS